MVKSEGDGVPSLAITAKIPAIALVAVVSASCAVNVRDEVIASSAIGPTEIGEPSWIEDDQIVCSMPKARSNALIIRLGAREGGQLSNLAVGGQNLPAYVVSVEVEPGKRPIYVVASSPDAILWRFTGATRRIQSLVVAAQADVPGSISTAVAASGVSRRRFHTVPNECFGAFDERGMGPGFTRRGLAAKVEKHLGRPADGIFADYRPQGIRIPSMVPFEVAVSRPSDLVMSDGSSAAIEWEEFVGDFRGGVAVIDAENVVSKVPLNKFEVYPYGAGLAQLLAAGAIERASPNGYSGFRILKPIRFPAALNGGYSVEFELKAGVPLPVGDPGHSRLWTQEKACLQGCR